MNIHFHTPPLNVYAEPFMDYWGIRALIMGLPPFDGFAFSRNLLLQYLCQNILFGENITKFIIDYLNHSFLLFRTMWKKLFQQLFFRGIVEKLNSDVK
jgi:hypothetical protein